MTKDEILKALECCDAAPCRCKSCSYEGRTDCSSSLARDTYALITALSEPRLVLSTKAANTLLERLAETERDCEFAGKTETVTLYCYMQIDTTAASLPNADPAKLKQLLQKLSLKNASIHVEITV